MNTTQPHTEATWWRAKWDMAAVQDYPQKALLLSTSATPPHLPPFTLFQPQPQVLGCSYESGLAKGDQVDSRSSCLDVFVLSLWAVGTVDLGMGRLYFWILDWPPWVQPAAKVGVPHPSYPLPRTLINPLPKFFDSQSHLKHTHSHACPAHPSPETACVVLSLLLAICSFSVF